MSKYPIKGTKYTDTGSKVFIDSDLRNIGPGLENLLAAVSPVYVTVPGEHTIFGRSWEMAASKILTGEAGEWTGTVEEVTRRNDGEYVIHYGRVLGTKLKEQIMKNVQTAEDDSSDIIRL
jgi:hypothetical protein